MENGDRISEVAKVIGAAGIVVAAAIRITKAFLDRRRNRSNKMLCQRLTCQELRIQDLEYQLTLVLAKLPREPC